MTLPDSLLIKTLPSLCKYSDPVPVSFIIEFEPSCKISKSGSATVLPNVAFLSSGKWAPLIVDYHL